MSREKWTLQRWTSRALIFLRNRLWARRGAGLQGKADAAEQRQAGRTQADTGNAGASRDTSAQRAPLTADHWHATQAHNTLKRHTTHSKVGFSRRVPPAGETRRPASHLSPGRWTGKSSAWGPDINSGAHLSPASSPSGQQIMFFAPLTRAKGYLAQI